MSRGEEKVKLRATHLDLYRRVAAVLLFFSITAFAGLSFAILYYLMIILLMSVFALLATPLVFVLGILIAAVSFITAVALWARMIPAWWFAVVSSFLICVSAALLQAKPIPEPMYLRLVAGIFLLVFFALICSRGYYFKSAREWRQD